MRLSAFTIYKRDNQLRRLGLKRSIEERCEVYEETGDISFVDYILIIFNFLKCIYIENIPNCKTLDNIITLNLIFIFQHLKTLKFFQIKTTVVVINFTKNKTNFNTFITKNINKFT